MPKRVMIVGAGLAGCLLAVYLARDGWEVDLREKRPDPRERGHIAGRSINLAISARGIKALRRAGLEEAILRDAIRMPGRMIHQRDGQLRFQRYSSNPRHAIQSISRSVLNLTLLDAAAAQPGVTVAFHQRCIGIDPPKGSATFVDDRSGQERSAQADLIVGADGAFSAVRDLMYKREGFDYQQSWLTHGYKEMCIPAVKDGAHAPFAMDPNALHIWPRGGSMMIALPNPDGSFTCTLFWPHKASAGSRCAFDTLPDAPRAREHFALEYADALSMMPSFDADYTGNPIGWMVTVRSKPWSAAARVTLIGDAAHAIVPFFGQGANASFEDCESLADALRANGADLAAALAAYELDRKRNTDAIAQMALENFIEMRDKTASPLFRLRKRVEHMLHAIAPGAFIPRYEMVSFHTIPYADALQRSLRQERLVLTAALLAPLVIAVVAWLALR